MLYSVALRPGLKEKKENKTEPSHILSSAPNAAGVSAFVLIKRAGAAEDFWHGRWKCWTEGGKRDALPSRGAGDSQPGTTLGSDRAVPGPSWGQECQALSPYISSPTPPPPRCPRPLISSSHTPPYILFYELAFGVSNCSFKVPVKEKNKEWSW